MLSWRFKWLFNYDIIFAHFITAIMITDLRVTKIPLKNERTLLLHSLVLLKQTRLNSWSSCIVKYEHLTIQSLIPQLEKTKMTAKKDLFKSVLQTVYTPTHFPFSYSGTPEKIRSWSKTCRLDFSHVADRNCGQNMPEATDRVLC